MRYVLGLALVLALANVTASCSSPASCVPGRSEQCFCGSKYGAQVCRNDGTWGTCFCGAGGEPDALAIGHDAHGEADAAPSDDPGTPPGEADGAGGELPPVDAAKTDAGFPDVPADHKPPTAIASVLEGLEVVPQTKLHLKGSSSTADGGPIVSWHWTVTQPAGSKSIFMATNTAPDPTFEVNVAGLYVFVLTIRDWAGATSTSAPVSVSVVPDEAIHVELLWDTPADPDETDEGPEAGADLDLHFMHPYAKTGSDCDGDGVGDPWFDGHFDCFWFNPNPDWASSDQMVDDDPGLDLADTDGAGPEIVNLNAPEMSTTYLIAAHYPDDHGFGPSQVEVRIYVYGALTYQGNAVELTEGDLWEVVTIDWPTGIVAFIPTPDGKPAIAHGCSNQPLLGP